MKKLNINIMNLILLFLLSLVGILDAADPGSRLIAIPAPVLLALISFLFGICRYKMRMWESILLIVLNAAFLAFTFHTKIYLLNLFILSLLIWNLAAPLIARFRQTLPAAVILAVFLAFVIPYYKLPFPLLPVLYLPMFLFGYQLRSMEIRSSKRTVFYCLAGMFIATGLLGNAFLRCLKIRDAEGRIFIQSLFGDKGSFVFAPIIVMSFILFAFCVLILLVRRFNFVEYADNHQHNWSSALVSGTAVLPLLYGITVLKPAHNSKMILVPVLALACIGIYLLMNFLSSRMNRGYTASEQGKGTLIAGSGVSALTMDEISAAAEESSFKMTVDMNKLLFHVLFVMSYVMCAILSIELIIRSNDIALTRYYTSTPSFAFNLLFVGVLYLLVTSVLGLKLGTIMALLVQAFLMLANYLKLTYFSEPFFPWDFGLVGDAVAISRDYISVYTIAIVAVIVLAGIILIVRNFRRVVRFLTPRPNIAMAAVMVLPLVFSLNLLSHSGLKQINVFKGWYDGVNEYVKNGTYVENVLYLQNIKNYVNSKPAGYSRQAMKQFEDKLGGATASGNKKPDIIVILGETYWNPENMSGVTFNKEIAPNLKKYQSGTMISPAFGGGTANVEFEVLTGLSNFFFNQSIIPYNVYFKRTFPSIIGAFKDSGYAAVAVHPNDGEFYNRAKVYKYMGFDKFEDIKSFDPSTQTKGNYVSDDNLVNKIEGILKQESGPVFIQGVTMQNHDPYTNEIKHYGSGREIQVESDKLNTDEKDVLSNFAQGVYDEDKALGKLIEVAKKNDRPTIILMYGDHLPRLGVGLPQGNYEIFDKLGYTEGKADPRSLKKFFETPYVLWSNYGELPRLNTMVSPSQLSLELLKDAGIEYPSYFNSLLELRKTHPYLNSYLESKTGLANDKSVQDYYKMQYDIMFGSRYLLKK